MNKIEQHLTKMWNSMVLCPIGHFVIFSYVRRVKRKGSLSRILPNMKKWRKTLGKLLKNAIKLCFTWSENFKSIFRGLFTPPLLKKFTVPLFLAISKTFVMKSHTQLPAITEVLSVCNFTVISVCLFVSNIKNMFFFLLKTVSSRSESHMVTYK